ncbi:MAG: FAD-dependent thymidylate synthase [Nitrospirota bacterium]
MGAARLKVKLLRHTPDPEGAVALAAKLCYSSSDIDALEEKIGSSEQSKFIERLVKMGHMSPFEHVNFTFGIEGISRACSHQLVRHRLASYSQQSQRYVSEQSGKSVDGLFDYVIPPSVQAAGKGEWFSEKMRQIQTWYDELVSCEIPNEDARFILPNAAETKIVLTMNGRELLHFFKVRCCERAQWEIREMATIMLWLVRDRAPNIFKKAGPVCLYGPCDQGEMYCGIIDEVRKRFGVVRV